MEGNENKNLNQGPEKDKELLGSPSEAEIMADPETKIEEEEPTLNITKPESQTLPEEIILPGTERPQPPEMPIEEKKVLRVLLHLPYKTFSISFWQSQFQHLSHELISIHPA